MKTVAPRRSSFLSCVFAVALSLVFAGFAHALSVDIVVPETNPAEVYQHGRTPFLAAAFDEKGGDVTDLATFTWSFPDAKEPVVGNPAFYRFEKTGKFTVTVTATLEKDSGSDQIAVNVVEAVGTKALPDEDDFELFMRVPDGDRLGTEVADSVEVVCRSLVGGLWPFVPFEWANTKFYQKVDGQWVFKGQDNPAIYEPGDNWSSYITWHTVDDPNAPIEWKAVTYLFDMMLPPGDPDTVIVTKEGTWTPNNTIVKATGDEIIKHHADDTSHTISWNITHSDDVEPDPRFSVTTTIYDLDGNVEATLETDNVQVGTGSVDWDENLPAADGIYTYRIVANHQDMAPPLGPCEDQDKSGVLTVTDVIVEDVDFKSRNLTLECDVDYTLSRQAGDGSLTVYAPDLALAHQQASIPTGSGQQEVHAVFDVDPEQMGTYYFIVSVGETQQDGEENRDGVSKPALRKGATTTILPRALDMYGRTAMGLGGSAEAEKARDEQEHGANGSNYPEPRYDASIRGHELTDVFWRLSSLYENGAPNPQADAIFWYLGHADPGVLMPDCQTISDPFQDKLYSGSGTNNPQDDLYYMGNMPARSLDRCVLVMLIGCQTAVDPDGAGGDPSILEAFLERGAGHGIGTLGPVYPPWAGDFSDEFWEYVCKNGQGDVSVEDAFDYAKENSGTPLQYKSDWYYERNGGATDEMLRPAHYQ